MLDRTRDGKISFDEYIEANRGALRIEFQRLDRNRDGGISREELEPKRTGEARAKAAARSADRWERHRSAKEGMVGGDND